MKEYKVTITETLELEVEVEAESMAEAECMVSDAWRNEEYILDAENFIGVEFKAEDTAPKHEMSYGELSSLFSKVNHTDHPPVTGYIVFTEDSFGKPYNEESRTYAVSSNNKAYQPGMGGYSIYGSCLDGTDPCLRLEGYMRGENPWKIEKCYMLKDEYEKLETDLSPAAARPAKGIER